MEARGGLPGYTTMLGTQYKHLTGGILVTGGSIFGLEANAGILAEGMKERKYKSWRSCEASCIYSNNMYFNKVYPDKALGRFAYLQNDKKLYNGQVGAGQKAYHGQGWGYRELKGGVKILVLCVNNALGTVYKDNQPVHYPGGYDGEQLRKAKIGKNTTIIVVVTNLDLDHDELLQMNQQVNVSVGESIRPFNTFFDGDALYTCSTRRLKKKMNPRQLAIFFMECADVLKEAIQNSIVVN
jgi:L-aminopeptidase/D-esterase-like protein